MPDVLEYIIKNATVAPYLSLSGAHQKRAARKWAQDEHPIS